jgi:hypothetical protein
MRPSVSVRKETRSDAPIVAMPHQRPETLSAQPIRWSIEKRPGPVAATAIELITAVPGPKADRLAAT